MNIGIICEYNPFHYGHLYHINKVKEMYPNSNIILVLSGWITERGDLSLIDKFKKADIALFYGVDLVVEIPFKYIQSADFFAKGAINILNELKCDKIVFGSETNDIDTLYKLANISLSKEYNSLVKEYTNLGINYPTALSKAFKKLCNTTIKNPNDILGLCYIKEIIKNKYNIEAISIKRDSNYNSKEIEGIITSATSIRELILNKKDIKEYVPAYSYKYLDNVIFLNDYFDLIKYKILSSDLTIYNGVNTDIKNRLLKYILVSNDLDELLSNIKTKRYTYNRLKRVLLFILLSITKEDCNQKLEYIRILGFTSKGRILLNKLKKEVSIKLLTNYNNKYMKKDLEITKILSLNKKIKNKIEFIEKEYKEKPLIK